MFNSWKSLIVPQRRTKAHILKIPRNVRDSLGSAPGKFPKASWAQVLGVRECWLLVFCDRGQRGFDYGESFVELLVGNDERNEDTNHIVESASRNGDEAVLITILCNFLCLGVRRLAGLRVAHQFDGAHAAESTNFADQGPFLLPGLGALFEMLADGGGTREQTVFLDGFARSQRGGTGNWMATVCATQRSHAGGIHDFGAAGHRGNGHASTQRFRHRNQIRLNSEMFRGEPF